MERDESEGDDGCAASLSHVCVASLFCFFLYSLAARVYYVCSFSQDSALRCCGVFGSCLIFRLSHPGQRSAPRRSFSRAMRALSSINQFSFLLTMTSFRLFLWYLRVFRDVDAMGRRFWVASRSGLRKRRHRLSGRSLRSRRPRGRDPPPPGAVGARGHAQRGDDRQRRGRRTLCARCRRRLRQGRRPHRSDADA